MLIVEHQVVLISSLSGYLNLGVRSRSGVNSVSREFMVMYGNVRPRIPLEVGSVRYLLLPVLKLEVSIRLDSNVEVKRYMNDTLVNLKELEPLLS